MVSYEENEIGFGVIRKGLLRPAITNARIGALFLSIGVLNLTVSSCVRVLHSIYMTVAELYPILLVHNFIFFHNEKFYSRTAIY